MNLLASSRKKRCDDVIRRPIGLSMLAGAVLAGSASLVAAQNTVRDALDDAAEARTDAILGTPDRFTPVAPTNIFATTPGLEQQLPRSQFTFNGVVPLFYNSNPLALTTGGMPSAEFSPVVGLAWTTPVFDLPLKMTARFRAEIDRFTQAPAADFDKLAGTLRVQYVDAANDQAYSPYIVYAPRWDFAPTYRSWLETRHDLNFGFNKIFSFDADLRRVPFSGNTIAETTWSFGVTAFFQRRFRDPGPSSFAFYLVPSMTYFVTDQWNVSLGAEFIRRQFDPYQGFTQEDWFLEPILTLEFVLPESWFGSARNATLFGRPALDFQLAYEANWSNAAGATYGIFHAGVALKLGWRF
jgi:hypothetical protein